MLTTLVPGARFDDFADLLRRLPTPTGTFDQATLLNGSLLLERENDLEIHWVPFETFNPGARVVLVGITPGWTQMELAVRTARANLLLGGSAITASRAADDSASFAGSMRRNLVEQLDALGLPDLLGIPSTNALFSEHADLLHSTSVIRYAVFRRGQNYTGHSPKPWESPLLWRHVSTAFLQEISGIPKAVVVPLGSAVQGALDHLVEARLIEPRRYLRGFPHPSGANGHRSKHFAQRKDTLAAILKDALSA